MVRFFQLLGRLTAEPAQARALAALRNSSEDVRRGAIRCGEVDTLAAWAEHAWARGATSLLTAVLQACGMLFLAKCTKAWAKKWVGGFSGRGGATQVLNELPLDSHSVATLRRPQGLLEVLGDGLGLVGSPGSAVEPRDECVVKAFEALQAHASAVEASGGPSALLQAAVGAHTGSTREVGGKGK